MKYDGVWLDPKRRTLTGMLESRAESQPDRVGLTILGEDITYGELVGQANAFARGMRSLGVEKGDVVAMLAENSSEHVYVQFASARIGAIEVMINTAYRGEFLAHQLRNCAAKLLIVDSHLLDDVMSITDQFPAPKAIVVVKGGADNHAGPAALVGLEELSSHPTGPLRDLSHPEWNDPCAIIYTSGTTGPSKGALMSHGYMVAFAENQARLWSRGVENETFYSVGPLFHLGAKGAGVLASIFAGARCVQDERFSVKRFWSRVREEDCNATLMLGSMILMLWRQEPSPDEGIDVVYATPCPVELRAAMERRWGCEFAGGYGLSEVGPITCSTASVPLRLGSAGKPIDSYYDVRIFDGEDEEVPAGGVGEIVVRPRRAHAMFEGYYNNPEATLGKLSGLWFHTGDLGKLDEDGYLYFIDRKKDSIRRRGENISSQEVEDAMNKHPDIVECAVIGVESDLVEDEVGAAVVLRPGADLSYEELSYYCMEVIPYFAVPRYMEFVDDLPRTPSGKVQKHKLRSEGMEGAWDREAAGIVLSGKRSRN